MVYFRCLHIERTFLIKVVFTRRVQGVWWVQPFRKNYMLSFKTAKMTFNSRKSTFLCVFITTQHSFCFPKVFGGGGGVSRPQRPPPGSAPGAGVDQTDGKGCAGSLMAEMKHNLQCGRFKCAVKRSSNTGYSQPRHFCQCLNPPFEPSTPP